MANSKLKDSIESVFKKLLSNKGEIFAEISLKWRNIVGEEFAKYSYPIDIKYYKTKHGQNVNLIIKAVPKADILQLQFASAMIMERINMYFGYNAISKIIVKT